MPSAKTSRGTARRRLAELASENGRPVSLVLGVYKLDGENTPGVGPVFAEHGLRCVPGARCYLLHGGARIDVTQESEGVGRERRFLHKEQINPDHIGKYKVGAHRGCVRRWAEERGLDP